MSIYQVKHRLRINNEVYPTGKNISLTEAQAQPLVKAGVVVKILETAIEAVDNPPITQGNSISQPVVHVATPIQNPNDTTLAVAAIKAFETATESITVAKPLPQMTAGAETVAQTPTADLPSNDNNAYGKLTKAELNAELDKRGITHDAKATNADLKALLVADDSKAK